MMGASRRLERLDRQGGTLLSASAFGLGGLLTAGVLTTALLGEANAGSAQADLVVLVAGAGLGSFVLGGLFWWRLVEVPRTASSFRGGAAGLLTGLLANFVAWFVHALWSLVTGGLGGSAVEVLGTMAFYVVLLGGSSLIVTGVVTGPVGLAVGVVLALARRRGLDGTSSPPSPEESAE